MKRLATIVASIVLGSVTVSCSLPTDDSAQVIAQAELAPSLQKVPTTTTAPPTQSQTRDFAYFLLEPRPESEQRVIRQVVFPIPTGSLFEAVEPMERDGFKETIQADPALINTVNQYDVVGIELDDGIATVFLESIGSEPPNVPVLRDVAAQLVWTLTGDGEVDGVRFNVDGAPQSIPTSTESLDRPVTTDDYATYNTESNGDATTTTEAGGSSTTSSSTTTTVPPE